MTARLHVASLDSPSVIVTGDDHGYLCRVLRLRVGDELVLFDGAGREAPARIVTIDPGPGAVELALTAPPGPAVVAPAPLALTLILGLLKGEKMELVVQKATELGVARIVPVSCARSVVRLDAARAGGRADRWRKIAREAARQCGRADTPTLTPVTSFAEAVAAAPADAFRAIFYEDARAVSLRRALPAMRPPAAVLAVGPEGGFDADEVAQARAAGFVVVGFGPRVLRAETAAIAALAVLGFALGDLG